MKRALTTIILSASLLFGTAASADRVAGSIPPGVSAGDIPASLRAGDLDIPEAPIPMPRGHIQRAVTLPDKPVKRAVPLPERPVKRAVPLPPGAVIRNQLRANANANLGQPPSARLRTLLEKHFGRIEGELRCQVRISGNLREIDCQRTIRVAPKAAAAAPSVPAAPAAPAAAPKAAPAPQATPAPSAPTPPAMHPKAAPTPAPIPAPAPSAAPTPKAADVAPAPKAAAPQANTCGMTSLELSAFNMLNKLRANNNLAQLSCDRNGVLAARRHSQDMCTRRYFAHVTPEGHTPWHRLKKAGARFKSAGENIAMGYTSAQDAHDGWVTSPGHFKNMVNGSFKRGAIGVATCGSQPYWTQLFMD